VTQTARRLLGPGLMTLAMLLVLVALGTWQVERLTWKRRLLNQIARAEQGSPVPLPADPSPFEKASVTGRFRSDLAALYGAEVRQGRTGPLLGARLIVPLERQGAVPVLVDRGWVPTERASPVDQPAGETTVVGYIHPAESAGWFSAPDNPAGRRFFTRDPCKIGAALGLDRVAPFTVVALGPTPPAGYPDPAQHLPRPPNNHLSYAFTWYALAGVLLAVFVVWARKGPSA
jgi:surfeit locus 1 family protein